MKNLRKFIGVIGLLFYRLMLLFTALMTLGYVMEKSLPFTIYVIAAFVASLSILIFNEEDFNEK